MIVAKLLANNKLSGDESFFFHLSKMCYLMYSNRHFSFLCDCIKTEYPSIVHGDCDCDLTINWPKHDPSPGLTVS
jgi:hypothetical protein